MIRVLHVVGQMNRGGAETMIMNLYRHIDREKIQFDFAVNTKQRGHFHEEIRALGGRIFPHPAPSESGFRSYGRAFAETLRRHGPFDAVHSHVYQFSGYVLFIAAQEGIQLRIAHSQNVDDGKGDSWKRQGYRWLMRRLIKWQATHMIGCSKGACRALYGGNWSHDSRVLCLPNAIDLEPFSRLPANRKCGRRTLGIPDQIPLIGHVGSFTHQKNHRFVLDVFAAIRRYLSSAELILVGDGSLRTEIETAVAEAGFAKSVHFLGIRNDVPNILSTLDLFLFPSRYEGLPVALVEAQAAGVQCLASENITDEVDIGCDLLTRLKLNAEPDVWARMAVERMRRRSVSWNERKEGLTTSGYDVFNSTKVLERIYMRSNGDKP